MRVLLCVHHPLDPDLGAPGVTLQLGEALERLGCQAEYYAFNQAFAEKPETRKRRVGFRRGRSLNLISEGVTQQLRFPWLLAAHLARTSGRHDVVDAATGDCWVWASLRRPGGHRRTALVTRAHGLEHVAHERAREAAGERGPELSWKYPVYHGGFRLWEVRRSLVLSDQCVLLNPVDYAYARDRLGVSTERLTVIPNGIAEHFHGLPGPGPSEEGPLRLAFIGRWTAYKGKDVLVGAAELLDRSGVEVSLTLLGTALEADAVLREFPERLRGRVEVRAAFENRRLPELLAGHEIFVFPTLSEGSSASLLEAMACGLAPVATAVGAAPEILDGSNGVLVETGDEEAMASAVERLYADRGALAAMRRRANETAQSFRWDDVAARTLELYERAVASRAS